MMVHRVVNVLMQILVYIGNIVHALFNFLRARIGCLFELLLHDVNPNALGVCGVTDIAHCSVHTLTLKLIDANIELARKLCPVRTLVWALQC